MLSNLQSWALKSKEHTAHRIAVSVIRDHRKYFMQGLYNSYLIIIASLFRVFMLCWTSLLVKIYVRFAKNQVGGMRELTTCERRQHSMAINTVLCMLFLQYLLINKFDHAAGMLEIHEGKSVFQSDAEP